MNAMRLALHRNARAREFAYLLYRDLSADHVPRFSATTNFPTSLCHAMHATAEFVLMMIV